MGLDAGVYETFKELGIDRMILRLTPAPLDAVLEQIEDYTAQVDAVR